MVVLCREYAAVSRRLGRHVPVHGELDDGSHTVPFTLPVAGGAEVPHDGAAVVVGGKPGILDTL